MYSANLPDFSNTHLIGNLLSIQGAMLPHSHQLGQRDSTQLHVGNSAGATLSLSPRLTFFFHANLASELSDRLHSQCNLDFNGLLHLENV